MKNRIVQRIHIAALSILLLAVSTPRLWAQTYSVLYSYPETNRNDTGVFSQFLAQGRDGNLYSTIAYGGTNSGGTAYRMTTAGQLTTLYNFCSVAGCTDGSAPYGGLTLGFDGNFYGTTQVGGTKAAGTVFKMTSNGALTPLYDFTNGNDDSAPIYTVLQGQDGNIYGVSEEQYNGQYGEFFKVTPAGVFSVVHDFAYSDGASPNLPTQGTDGNFYGSAKFGGDPTCRCGAVYKITPSGATTVLHTFKGYPNDGTFPVGALVQGPDGFFYGVTYEGGSTNQGTIFKINASGSSYSVLHNFVYRSPSFDGQLPYTGLTVGSDGNLYGTTANGGAHSNAGVIYQITTSGTEKILYNFCSQTGCVDGFFPESPLVQHTNGEFYGTTTGSSLGGGVFYRLNTGLKPFADLVNWTGKVGKTVEILGQGFTGTTQVSSMGRPPRSRSHRTPI